MLLSVATGREPALRHTHNGYPDRRFAQDLARVPGLRALRHSAAFTAALKETAAAPTWFTITAYGCSPNLQAGWAAAAAGKPFVVSPRGMLSPPALAFSRARKDAFWKLLQGPVIRARPASTPRAPRNTTSCVRSDCAIRSR